MAIFSGVAQANSRRHSMRVNHSTRSYEDQDYVAIDDFLSAMEESPLFDIRYEGCNDLAEFMENYHSFNLTVKIFLRDSGTLFMLWYPEYSNITYQYWRYVKIDCMFENNEVQINTMIEDDIAIQHLCEKLIDALDSIESAKPYVEFFKEYKY